MTDPAETMTSHRPYLLRALYEWITDNGMTPHVLVDATRAGVQVPLHAVKEGKIVLNIAERAVSRLEMTNDLIRFSARFGGVSHTVSVPVGAVLAIYARETGQGMALPEDTYATDPSVEAGTDEDAGGLEEGTADTGAVTLTAVPSPDADGGDDDDSDDDGPQHPTPRRGGHLRIVK